MTETAMLQASSTSIKNGGNGVRITSKLATTLAGNTRSWRRIRIASSVEPVVGAELGGIRRYAARENERLDGQT